MITIMIQEAPYLKSDKAWNALKLAQTLLAYEKKVNVFLTDEAVVLARPNHEVPADYANLEELLLEIIQDGGVVKACRQALKKRGIGLDQVIEGIGEGSTAILTNWTIESEKLLSF
ncbi:MAG: DsrE family protein [Spirochaetota bacterium]|nr:DsrE family protein [Spirochaetota bacterium]